MTGTAHGADFQGKLPSRVHHPRTKGSRSGSHPAPARPRLHNIEPEDLRLVTRVTAAAYPFPAFDRRGGSGVLWPGMRRPADGWPSRAIGSGILSPRESGKRHASRGAKVGVPAPLPDPESARDQVDEQHVQDGAAVRKPSYAT